MLLLIFCMFLLLVSQQSCRQLESLLQQHYAKNLSKFRLYCDRNIFVPRVDNSGSSSTNNSQTNTSNLSSQELDKALEDANAEVEQLRSRYLAQLAAYRQLSLETSESAALLADMKNAVFNLKLATSEDDEMTLAAAVGGLAELQGTLANLTDNASGKSR